MAEPYYTWRDFETTLAGEPVRWAGKPGLESWDSVRPAARLLAEGLAVQAGQRVLDLLCGAGVCGVLAARRGALVTWCDDDIVAVQAARRTLALNGFAGEVVHGNGVTQPCQASASCSDDATGPFDLVLLDAPRGREWVRHLLGAAARALRPGGKLLLAGPNRGGIKGFVEDARELVGPCEVTRIKAGHRLAVGERRPVAAPRQGTIGDQVCEATIHGQTIRFVTRPGVFSRGQLDAGTRALIETMVIRADDVALDLGCGCGVVGAMAARTARQVILVDSSAAALDAARATLELNGVTNAQVLASDCASAVRDVRFDVIAMNPPFHQGLGVELDVARQFVRDAVEILAPGGRLFLVANRFIRYERVVDDLRRVSRLTTAYQDNRFRVLEVVR